MENSTWFSMLTSSKVPIKAKRVGRRSRMATMFTNCIFLFNSSKENRKPQPELIWHLMQVVFASESKGFTASSSNKNCQAMLILWSNQVQLHSHWQWLHGICWQHFILSSCLLFLMFTVASSIHTIFGQNDKDNLLQLSSLLLPHSKAAMRIADKQDNGDAL